FYINPEGQRLRKAGGSTGTTYFAPDSSGDLMAENDNGTWVDYVRLNGRLIGRISGGQVDAIHTDQVDRPDTVTDASQNVIWHAKNYPFGSTVTLANITLNLGFPGQYYDAETWLWNNGYRDYNSGFGRYIESDPIGLGGGVNTYAYVGSNPISYVDFLGLAQSLEYVNVTGGPSDPMWQIQWQLSEPSPTGGLIVQQINMMLPDGTATTYWEAWPVAPCSTVTEMTAATLSENNSPMASLPIDDTFEGGKSITASARFYEGLNLPNSFVQGSVVYASGLRTTSSDPHLPINNATAPVNRSWAPSGP